MKGEPARYGIDELAELGGVSRRTVRYYTQERLLPPPLGVGRGRHYGREHLDALLKVRSLQEAGLSLDAIQGALSGGRPAPPPSLETPGRSVWRRLSLAPGVELHVRGDIQLPRAPALQELVEWCRVHIAATGESNHDDH